MDENRLIYFIFRLSEVQLEIRSDSKTSIESNDVSKMVGNSSVHTPTPTWTEGTPSFTESSSSCELGKPAMVDIFPVNSVRTY
jgi:1-phosphatidylinositol-4-phosphate 5-kinase